MHPAQDIHRYGIRLRPIVDTDVETVRRWRNAEHVRSKMEYQTPITAEMQALWWQQLDALRHHYFIIEQAGQGVGVIHAKEIDWESGTAETGIFIGESAFLDSFVPVLAVLALMDALFEDYGLQKLIAKVKADETKIMAFNRQLGYAVMQEAGSFVWLSVGHAEYVRSTVQLRQMAQRLAGGGG